MEVLSTTFFIFSAGKIGRVTTNVQWSQVGAGFLLRSLQVQSIRETAAYLTQNQSNHQKVSLWNDLYCVEWGVKLYSLTPVALPLRSVVNVRASPLFSECQITLNILCMIDLPRNIMWDSICSKSHK